MIKLRSFLAKTNLYLVSATILVLFSASAHSQSRADRRQIEQIEEFCVGCHNFEDYAGSFDLETILGDDIAQHTQDWEKGIRKMRAGMMPPPGQDRPNDRAYLQLTEWLENQIDENAPLNPGTKTCTG